MAGIAVLSVRLFADGKGIFVAFRTAAVHRLVFAQGRAEGGKFFGIITDLVFGAVINADLDPRQKIKVVQKRIHFLRIVRLHFSNLPNKITIFMCK